MCRNILKVRYININSNICFLQQIMGVHMFYFRAKFQATSFFSSLQLY